MSLIKQLFPSQVKFTPASSEVNWTRINTLVHGPGAGDDHNGDINSAVFACLMAIATAYPEPPICVYRKTGNGKSKKLTEDPMQKLLYFPTPNGELDLDEMRFWIAWAKNVDGNAYWLKVRSGDALSGNVVQLWPISPTLMTPVTEKGSGDWISYYAYQREPGKPPEHVPVKNVIHFRLGLDDKDMRKGLAPLKALVRQISTDEEADKFVDALLKNYAVPGLVVIPTGSTVVKKGDAEDIEETMASKFSGSKRGRVVVMSKESKIEQFGFNPKEMDMSMLHRIPEERISAVIGVPAIVAGLGAGLDAATYNNTNALTEWFTEHKMIPQWRADARKLNASLKPDFTSDPNIYLDHDLTDVRALQTDEDTKYTRLSTGLNHKPFITRNEARTDVGLDPIEGWDEEDIAPPPPPPPAPANNNQDNQNNQGKPQNGKTPQNGQNGKNIDLERWQRKAIHQLADGKSALCEFDSQYIPAGIKGAIQGSLEAADSEDMVKAVFENAMEWEAYP